MRDYIEKITSLISEEQFCLRVRRSNMLEDTLIAVNRAAFSPYKTIVVCYYVIIPYRSLLVNYLPEIQNLVCTCVQIHSYNNK